MKVRPGIIFSSTAHAALLAYVIVGLSSAKPFEVGSTEALPIEILTPQEFDAMTKGSKTSKTVDAPKQKAEKVAEAESEPADNDLKVAKEEVQQPPSSAPPPEAVKAEQPPKPLPDPAKLEAEKAEKAAKAEAAAKAEKAAQEKVAAEKAAAKAASEKAAQEKAEKLAASQAAEAELRAKEQAAEKAAKEKAEADRVAKAEAEKAAKEKAEAEKAAKLAAEKAAKEKAEKLAKLEAEKAAKEKAEAEKKAAERKFDPSKIASLLGDKPSSSQSAMKDVRDPSRKASSARDAAPETTAGTNQGTATKLSTTNSISASQRAGVKNAIHDQVMQCWNPPVGAADDGSLAVKVSFSLNTDGTLASAPIVTNSSSNPAFRAAAGAATRAVQRCAPLKLPADAYDYWKQVEINFDPKDMMGG